MMNEEQLEERVVSYWTKRAVDFGSVRNEELNDVVGSSWKEYLLRYIPHNAKKILDVGTGTGFFCFLLEEEGYHMTGIDLTPSMIEEARKQARERNCQIDFQVMNAQELEFEDSMFDAVITRNLTWTLPDVEKAYSEWFRVLKTGGLLLNFDANYRQGLDKDNEKDPAELYGHRGVTRELKKENDAITMAMEIGKQMRPLWDEKILKEIGFSSVDTDTHANNNLIRACSDDRSPLFMIRAVK